MRNKVREELKYIYPEPLRKEYSSPLRFQEVHTQWENRMNYVVDKIMVLLPNEKRVADIILELREDIDFLSTDIAKEICKGWK